MENSDRSSNTFLYPEKQIDVGCIVLPSFYINNDPIFAENTKKLNDPIFPFNSMTVPYLGSQVWICGYPGHIEEQTESNFLYCISTFKPGLVTWKPSANMVNTDLSHITLIESNASYGNSGGPVFSMQENLELVGILTGGYEDINTVWVNGKQIFDPATKNPIIAKTRAGVSIIEKAEYVKKLIYYTETQVGAFLKAYNKK